MTEKNGSKSRDLKGAQWRFPFWYLVTMLALLWIWQTSLTQLTVKTIAYSDFKTFLKRGEITEASVKETEVLGQIKPKAARTLGTNAPPAPKDAPSTEFLFRTVRVEDPRLVQELEAGGVKFVGVRPTLLSQMLWAWLVPIALMLFFWSLLSRKFGEGSQSILSIGKSKAKLVVDKATGVTFADVAGCEEAKFELEEVVDFLGHPGRYKSLGARIPKGVLLVGPPGTGKTLLARAVAGEARVPFFSISGSDFVEMFVGVGAARVRDMFKQAKAHGPCIVFIDELDAIGRQRGVHMGNVNDEREQTLNQLLVELDGFEPNSGVIILAATNRPEVLDRALLRPGRFDRQVVVDAPDIQGREQILKVHARNKPLAEAVDLRKIAQGTPGFSGADLANAMNEAALLAARRKAKEITQADLEEAVEKVVAGPERKSRRLSEKEKRRVAYHETGHALVAALSEGADPVHKISIIPRGRAALGYTLQLPNDEQFLLTKEELLARIRVLLGGRAAEELIFGTVTTGAENDLERATTLARQIVAIYGMSDKLGLARVASRQGAWVATDAPMQRDCSEATAREVDEEVKELLKRCYQEAREILVGSREKLELISTKLLAVESMDRSTFCELLGSTSADETEPAPGALLSEAAAN